MATKKKEETARTKAVKRKTEASAIVKENTKTTNALTKNDTKTTEVKASVKEEPQKEVVKASAKKEEPKKETAKAPAKKETKKEAVKAPAKKEEPKKETAKAPAKKEEPKKETAKAPAKKETKKEAVKAPAKKEEPKKETAKAPAKKEPKKEAAKASAKKEPKKETAKAPAKKEPKKETAKAPAKKVESKKEAVKAAVKEEPKKEAVKAPVKEEPKEEAVKVPVKEEPKQEETPVFETPRRSVAFIGSECYPFVKTGGLGDVMYALPRALVKQNCDVKVILPRYECIPQKYQEKMQYKGAFQMDLCQDGRSFYVGIMEYECDGVVYDFIDNQDFFSGDKPYYSLVDDIPKFCYFGKAALAALNYLNWIPNVIHCHDWQAGLVPIYLRTFFEDTPIGNAKTIITIHNLRFQGIYNIETIKYWSNLPDYVFNKDTLTQNWLDANMFKGGLAYSNMITTVSNTYAGEIQSWEYGEGLEAHLRYHSAKLRGIINGIDYDIWNPATDSNLSANYDIANVIAKKKEDKKALQKELGLQQDEHKFVIGLISRLTNQKGLDLINAIFNQIMDEHTQVVVLGTGDAQYEDAFRYYENTNKGQVASCIQYDEARAHRIYAGVDALLVPSRFEPCGLTQLTAMHYGTIPIVRETGGLKDTVEPYNQFSNCGNGFTFDRYESGLLLDAMNRAKTLYFTNRWCWDEMVQRDMDKDVSWDNAAKQYKNLYLELTQY